MREGRTILNRSFSSSPFKVADVTENRDEGELRLILMSASPGVLDGDSYSFSIRVGKDSQVRFETQSFQRIFGMEVGAEQGMEVVMDEGSSLTYLPHPVVPHKNAIFKSRTRIILNKNCSLQWGEIISCGRKQNNEVFQFASYRSITEIFFKDRLVVKENILLLPRQLDLNSIGQLEGYTHQASLLYWNEGVQREPLMAVLMEKLELEEGICFGLSLLPVNGLVIRILGHKAEDLFSLLQQLSCSIGSLQAKQTNKMGTDVRG